MIDQAHFFFFPVLWVFILFLVHMTAFIVKELILPRFMLALGLTGNPKQIETIYSRWGIALSRFDLDFKRDWLFLVLMSLQLLVLGFLPLSGKPSFSYDQLGLSLSLLFGVIGALYFVGLRLARFDTSEKYTSQVSAKVLFSMAALIFLVETLSTEVNGVAGAAVLLFFLICSPAFFFNGEPRQQLDILFFVKSISEATWYLTLVILLFSSQFSGFLGYIQGALLAGFFLAISRALYATMPRYRAHIFEQRALRLFCLFLLIGGFAFLWRKLWM